MAEQTEPTTPDAAAATQRAAQREVRDFRRVHEQRRRQLPRALLVGVLSGLIAVLFRAALNQADRARELLLAYAHAHPALLPLPPLLCAAGAGAAVYMVRQFAPETSGSGIPHVKAVLHGMKTMLWPRVLAVKFCGGVAGIGAGMALGREGPTIQMGAAVGEMVGGRLAGSPRERRTLIAAGAGAGLSAAFNAPLAGLVFVLEEVQRDFSPGIFTAALVASVAADVTTRMLLGQMPVFFVQTASIPPLTLLPYALLLGLLTGVLGVLFNRGLLASLALFDRLAHWPAWSGGALVGLGIGLLALVAPSTVGSGHHIVERMLNGELTLAALVGFFLLRFLLTMLSYGTGAPGGIFAPLLVLGAAIGLCVGSGAAYFDGAATSYLPTFAVVGMAAYFSAVVRAPLTGMVLMVEMSGDYALVLPLAVACLTAYGIADFLRDLPVYEALLERDLLRTQATPAHESARVVDLTIGYGAPFAGKRIRDLGLPQGSLVILLRRRLREWVPTADSELAADDQITVLVAPEASAALPMLRKGAGLD